MKYILLTVLFFMNKMFLFLLLPLFALSNAMEHDSAIIERASYFVFKGVGSSIAGVVPVGSKHVTFYTADGDPIQTIKYNRSLKAETMLDLSAPKPKPASYEVKYWPAIDISMMWGLIKAKKGVPGDFIYFYDKNDNCLNSYRFNKETQVITVFEREGTKKFYFNDPESLKDFPLDLSQLKK